MADGGGASAISSPAPAGTGFYTPVVGMSPAPQAGGANAVGGGVATQPQQVTTPAQPIASAVGGGVISMKPQPTALQQNEVGKPIEQAQPPPQTTAGMSIAEKFKMVADFNLNADGKIDHYPLREKATNVTREFLSSAFEANQPILIPALNVFPYSGKVKEATKTVVSELGAGAVSGALFIELALGEFIFGTKEQRQSLITEAAVFSGFGVAASKFFPVKTALAKGEISSTGQQLFAAKLVSERPSTTGSIESGLVTTEKMSYNVYQQEPFGYSRKVDILATGERTTVQQLKQVEGGIQVKTFESTQVGKVAPEKITTVKTESGKLSSERIEPIGEQGIGFGKTKVSQTFVEDVVGAPQRQWVSRDVTLIKPEIGISTLSSAKTPEGTLFTTMQGKIIKSPTGDYAMGETFTKGTQMAVGDEFGFVSITSKKPISFPEKTGATPSINKEIMGAQDFTLDIRRQFPKQTIKPEKLPIQETPVREKTPAIEAFAPTKGGQVQVYDVRQYDKPIPVATLEKAIGGGRQTPSIGSKTLTPLEFPLAFSSRFGITGGLKEGVKAFSTQKIGEGLDVGFSQKQAQPFAPQQPPKQTPKVFIDEIPLKITTTKITTDFVFPRAALDTQKYKQSYTAPLPEYPTRNAAIPIAPPMGGGGGGGRGRKRKIKAKLRDTLGAELSQGGLF